MKIYFAVRSDGLQKFYQIKYSDKQEWECFVLKKTFLPSNEIFFFKFIYLLI